MDIEEKEKSNTQEEEPLTSVGESCALPNPDKMTAEEKKAYLDDLFFGNVFGQG
jgi:hypothetical protein